MTLSRPNRCGRVADSGKIHLNIVNVTEAGLMSFRFHSCEHFSEQHYRI